MKRRILSAVLVIVLVFSLLPFHALAASVTASGTCGENLTWKLYSDGELVISGTGAMKDYGLGYAGPPWNAYSDRIKIVTIQNGVTSIGAYAFAWCESLWKAEIPTSVLTIGDDAFYSCEFLSTVAIPASVTAIGQFAFAYCDKLQTVEIPSSVTSMGENVFSACRALTAIHVAAENPNYSSVDGVLFNKDQTAMLQYPSGRSEAYTIPDGVTSTERRMFYNSGVTSIVVPASVTSIEKPFCSACSKLTSVTFCGSVPEFVGDDVDAFSGITATVYYPEKDPTWTEEARQNYGGTLTWVPYRETLSSGTCGNDLTWTLYEDGELVISGTGAMKDYGYDDAPWYSSRSSIKAVTIQQGVTSIGANAFEGCSSLISIEIPDSVTSIGSFAFTACGSLTIIEIPEGVTQILDCTFSGCSSLTSVKLPETVKIIELMAFSGCSSLTSIDIPDGVTGIGYYAFSGCTSLESMTLGKGVATVGDYAFAACSNLESVFFTGSVPAIGENIFSDIPALTAYYPKGDATWTAEKRQNYGAIAITWEGYGRGVVAEGTCGENLTWKLYDDGELVIDGAGAMDDFGLVPWDSYRENIKTFTIEEGVARLDDEAFAACYSLTEFQVAEDNENYSSQDGVLFDKEKTTLLVFPLAKSGSYTIPNGVTSIEGGAFIHCSGLTSVVLPDSVENIGTYAFFNCNAMTSVTLGTGLTKIGEKAFSYCNKLERIRFGNQLTSIGEAAFAYCANLTSVEIPASVTNIGAFAFGPCNSLTEINVAAENTVYSSVDDVLLSKDGKTLIFCPGGKSGSYTVPDGVTSIGKEAFSTATKLTEIVLPDSVTTIGPFAFHCNDYANNYLNSSLESVTLGKGVATVGDYAFAACSNLESVFFTGSVPAIGENIFSDIPALTAYYPEGDATWTAEKRQNYGAETVTWVEKEKTMVANGNCGTNLTWTLYDNGELEISGSGLMADYRSAIFVPWFEYRESIQKVTIEENVLSVGNRAFSGCVNLSTVDFANSVQRVGDQAFSSCVNLKQLVLPESMTELGSMAFSGCSNMECILIDHDNLYYSSSDGVVFNKDQSKLVQYPTAKMGDYSVPSTVTVIDNQAFAFCNGLTGIKISANVEKIGAQAFWGCQSLERIDVDSGNEGYTSFGGVLFDKTMTTLLAYPAKKTGAYIIPAGVSTIVNSAFSYCNNVTSITIPLSVKTIDAQAFLYCNGITSIIIPSSVTEIGMNGFMGCTKLERVFICGDAPSMGDSMFSGVNATVYYSPNFETWTDEIMQDYRGTIIWEVYRCATGNHIAKVEDNEVQPNCGKTGLTKGSHCDFCGEVIEAQTVIPTVGSHSYDIDEAVEPTCTESGLGIGSSCHTCGYVHVEQKVIPATGHTEIIQDAVEATCLAPGKTAGKYCKVCDKVLVEQEEIPQKDHTLTIDEPKVPTCTEPGWESVRVRCEVCDTVMNGVPEIPATGHTYTAESFVWSDDLSTATVNLHCTCGHEETVECQVECDAETSGKLILTATVQLDGETYEDTKTIEAKVEASSVTVTLPSAKAGTMVMAVSYVNGRIVRCDLVELEGNTATLTIADGEVKIFFLSSNLGLLLPSMKLS